MIGVEGARSRFAVGRHWDCRAGRAERKGLGREPVGWAFPAGLPLRPSPLGVWGEET